MGCLHYIEAGLVFQCRPLGHLVSFGGGGGGRNTPSSYLPGDTIDIGIATKLYLPRRASFQYILPKGKIQSYRLTEDDELTEKLISYLDILVLKNTKNFYTKTFPGSFGRLREHLSRNILYACPHDRFILFLNIPKTFHFVSQQPNGL